MSQTASILVLEDDEPLREMVVETLEDHGYIAQGAEHAEQAIELAIRYPFQLAISDVRMAGDLDGLGAMEVLKRRNPAVRIIIVTGYASPNAPSRAATIQVDDYLYKPFLLTALLQAVKQTLHKSEERLSYSQLFKHLLRVPLQAAEKVEEARRDSLFQSLDSLREQVLDGFFVKVRANDQHLTKGAALDIWDRLEPLEIHYHMLSNYLKEFSVETVQRLGSEYRRLHELITLKAQNQSVGSSDARGPDKADRGAFFSFYDRVQNGLITSEQVKIAAVLRRPGWLAR